MDALQVGCNLAGIYFLYRAYNVYRYWYHNPYFSDRRQQNYFLGENGTGKTEYLKHCCREAINLGCGAIWITTHGGKSATNIGECTIINPLKKPGIYLFTRYSYTAKERSILAKMFVNLLNKIHESSWGDNIDHILRLSTLAVLEYQEKTKEHVTPETIYRFLTDEKAMYRMMTHVDNETTRNALIRAKDEKSSYEKAIRKIEKLLTESTCYDFLCDANGLDLKELIAEGKFVVCDYDPHEVGKPYAEFLAEVTATLVTNVVLERKEGSKNFAIVMDEFQTYSNEIISELLTEGRKRGAMVFMANQYLSQLPDKLQNAVAQCGTKVFFRITAKDARLAQSMMGNHFKAEEFVNLPNFHALAKVIEYGNPKYKRIKAPKPL